MDFDFTELRLLRIAANLKQADVGKIIGVSPSTISNWENGTTDVPVGMLKKLMNFYGVGFDHFMVTKPEGKITNEQNNERR